MAQLTIGKISASAAAALLVTPVLIGCGGPGASDRSGANMPPVDDTRYGYNPPAAQRAQTMPEQKRGLSTGQKLAILGGAAALYYMYNKHKKAQQTTGVEGQYYLSKNGRVYYRDEQGRAHWVTPPPQGIQVPEQEAMMYRDFQGYNGNTTGRTLEDIYFQQQQRGY
jgi:hypothetical protein